MQFEWAVDYQIALASRHGFLVTVVAVGGGDGHTDPACALPVLKEAMRSSDVFFSAAGGGLILMSQTSDEEAAQATRRLQAWCGPGMNVLTGSATFPHESAHGQTLIQMAVRRLKRAESANRILGASSLQ